MDQELINARIKEENSTAERAGLLGFRYMDLSGTEKKDDLKSVLSLETMYHFKVVPLIFGQGFATFGITVNSPQQVSDKLREFFTDQQVTVVMISDSSFKEYMLVFDPPKKVKYEEISLGQAGTEDLIKEVSQTLDQVRADDIFAYLAQQAHKLGASDIHIETAKNDVGIRFRIDGVLHPIARLSHDKYRTLQGTIASAGNVSTSAPEAQQGHVSQKVKMITGEEVMVNMRLETVPTIHGMDVVMRLFNLDQSMYNLDRLGLNDDERAVVDDIVNRPSGLMMVVGPTGSGKTTTLYSLLNSLNDPSRKIITLEDPVEYQFEGITQISLNSKTSKESNFADNLRAVLRLDPDVVMVGEIRDTDTAKTALQASLTGHLVLTTFHASSAAAAMMRLADIMGENPLFTSAIRLVMAQRLVRRLDDNTKVARSATDYEIEHIQAVLDTLPPHYERPSLEGLQVFDPGCSEENPFGFAGQIALREQFQMTHELQDLLQRPVKELNAHIIEHEAVQNGMKTMLQNGILEVIAGRTTMEEVYRVVG